MVLRGRRPVRPARRGASAREGRRQVEAALIGLEESAAPWWPTCWERGSAEGVPADRLFDELADRGSGVRVVHGLRVVGTSTSVDHVLVGPGGVVVVDTETCPGRVRSDGVRLRVGRRDRSDVVDVALWQTEVVRAELLRRGLGDVPVRGALHWTTLNDLGIASICLRGIPLLSAGAIVGLARAGDRVSPWAARRVADVLGVRTPPS